MLLEPASGSTLPVVLVQSRRGREGTPSRKVQSLIPGGGRDRSEHRKTAELHCHRERLAVWISPCCGIQREGGWIEWQDRGGGLGVRRRKDKGREDFILSNCPLGALSAGSFGERRAQAGANQDV